jgi:hypothetical protein
MTKETTKLLLGLRIESAYTSKEVQKLSEVKQAQALYGALIQVAAKFAECGFDRASWERPCLQWHRA